MPDFKSSSAPAESEDLPGIAVIGVGGYAAVHHRTIQRLEESGRCRLVATCDPDSDRMREADEQFGFTQKGVELFSDYREMIEKSSRVITVCAVPTPIPLHAEMHAALVDAGIACYLEKPPTLFLPEWKQMVEKDKEAHVPTAVGFNFIHEPERQSLRARLHQGEFGTLEEVGFLGLWPRPCSYYQRNHWAGRFFAGQTPVLDSPIGNALAHYVHNMLYWGGPGEGSGSWTKPVNMEAELYRVNRIETTDTVFLRGELENGCTFKLAAIHACEGNHVQLESLKMNEADIQYRSTRDRCIYWRDGREDRVHLGDFKHLDYNIGLYLDVASGREKRASTQLQDTEAFVLFITLAMVAGGRIHTVPEEWVELQTEPELRAIKNIREVAEDFLASGQFPSEQGLPWGKPGGSADLDTLHTINLEQHYRKMEAEQKTQ